MSSDAAAFVPKFFLISGVILIVSGVAQTFVRPRKPNETTLEKILNRAVLRAVVFSMVVARVAEA